MAALQTLDIGGTMDMPTFDYSTAPDGPRADEHTSIEPAERPVIESASASTAPQENSSNFAYILTGAVLGVIALLLLALTLLIFGLFDAAYSSPGHMGDGLSYYESHTLDRDAERPDADLDGFVDA